MTISNKLAQTRIDKLAVLSDIILKEYNLHKSKKINKYYSVRSHLLQISLDKYHLTLVMCPDYVHVDNFVVKVITECVYDWYVIFDGRDMSFNELLNNQMLERTLTAHECTATYF